MARSIVHRLLEPIRAAQAGVFRPASQVDPGPGADGGEKRTHHKCRLLAHRIVAGRGREPTC